MSTAAQLITRVRAEGVAQHNTALQSAGNAVTKTAARIRAAGQMALGLAKGLGAVAGALTVAGVAGAKFALDTAMEFDTAQRKLEAFLGSSEEAARTMKFIQGLAGPSLFETKDLAKGATLLAAYGLNVQKVLPLVDKLAAAMGESGESVSEVARVFGRLKAGDFGEAFERLRDFGISFDDLREKGLKFSKSNEYLGTRLQALAAVSAIIEERFGRISDIMQDSPAAKFASAMDSIRRAGVAVGRVLLGAVVPVVETVSKFVGYLTSSGRLEKVTRSLLSMFSVGGGRNMLERSLATVFTLVERIPTALSNVRNAFAATFGFLEPLMKPVAAILGFMAGTRLVTGIMAVGNAVMQLARAFRALSLIEIVSTAFSPGGAAKLLGGAIGAGAAIFAVNKMLDKNGFGKALESVTGGLFGKDVGKDTDDLLKQFHRGSGAGIGDSLSRLLAESLGTGFTKDDAKLDIGRSLSETERNTRRTAEATERILDLNRASFGGGELGRIGVTPVEFAGFRNRQSVQVTVKLQPGMSLEQMIAVGAEQAILDYARQSGGRRL